MMNQNVVIIYGTMQTQTEKLIQLVRRNLILEDYMTCMGIGTGQLVIMRLKMAFHRRKTSAITVLSVVVAGTIKQ